MVRIYSQTNTPFSNKIMKMGMWGPVSRWEWITPRDSRAPSR